MRRGGLVVMLGAAAAALSFAPALAAGAEPGRVPFASFDPFSVPVPSVPVRDVVYPRTNVLAARAAATASAKRYPVHDGSSTRVMIAVSDSCTHALCNAARPQRIANFLGTLPHGNEMNALRVELVTDTQMKSVCGQGALACYFAGQNQMFVSGNDDPNPSDGATRDFVLAHEYGHHLADHRRNPPFRPTIDWGTKRWSSHERVCQGVRDGAYFPGDEGIHYYRNPGEAFAESFAFERFPGKVRWQWAAELRPSRKAFAAIRLDAERPWVHRTRLVVSGDLSGGGARRAIEHIRTPLDGVLSLRLKAPGDAGFSLALRDRAGRVLRRAGSAARHESINYTICGQARVMAVISRTAGSGTFKLTVKRP